MPASVTLSRNIRITRNIRIVRRYRVTAVMTIICPDFTEVDDMLYVIIRGAGKRMYLRMVQGYMEFCGYRGWPRFPLHYEALMDYVGWLREFHIPQHRIDLYLAALRWFMHLTTIEDVTDYIPAWRLGW